MDQVANRIRPPEERRTVPLCGSAGDSRGPCLRSVDAQPQAAAHVNPPAGAAGTCRPGRLHPRGGWSVGGDWRRTRASRARGIRLTRTPPATVVAAATSAGCAPCRWPRGPRPLSSACSASAGTVWLGPGLVGPRCMSRPHRRNVRRTGRIRRSGSSWPCGPWSLRCYRPHCGSCREAFSKGRRVRRRLSIPSLPRHRPYCPASTRTPATRRAEGRAGGRILRVRGIRTGRSEGCLVPVAAARAVRLTPEVSQPAATGATVTTTATQRRRVT